jgi:hypothetical protein
VAYLVGNGKLEEAGRSVAVTSRSNPFASTVAAASVLGERMAPLAFSGPSLRSPLARLGPNSSRCARRPPPANLDGSMVRGFRHQSK